MIKARRWFPACERMASCAVRAHLAAVFIRVTAHTFAREAQIGAVQIFHLDASTIGGRNIFRLVTFFAGNSHVLSLEDKTCLGVIELFAARIPSNEGKIHAIMIGMAFRAFLTRGIRADKGRVQSALVDNAVADFGVAFQTLQLRSAAFQIVALRAIRRSIERLVGSCEGSRRNLRASR